MTLEARIGERTRIARDLHDTMLQSFHGLLLRFQTVSILLPERPIEAKEKLDSAIEQAAGAITEGRDAVQGLRASTVERNDLALAISTLGEEFENDSSNHRPATFRVSVEGQARDLHPILRDEIYKIAAEALRNAFHHAQAKQVEVEIRYDHDNFDCACATTERAWMRRFSPAMVLRDTMVCAGCANEPHLSKVSWRYGAKSMRERKWNCAFLPAPPTRQIANVPGCCKNLPERRRHKVMNAGSSQIRILTAEFRQRLVINDRRTIRTAMLCGSLLYLLLRVTPLHALDPNLRLTQYMHKSWGTQDGSLPAAMSSITQTSDGFLWFSALPKDIYRFDGVRFVSRTLPTHDKAMSTIVNVYGDHAGGLWALGERDIVHLKSGVVTSHFNLDGPRALNTLVRILTARCGWCGAGPI